MTKRIIPDTITSCNLLCGGIAVFLATQGAFIWAFVFILAGAFFDFFDGLTLDACVFDYSTGLINECKSKGMRVACLTDLPNGMPDSLFRYAITELEPLFDLYVSSQICGYRKPNARGLEYIADQFGIAVSELLFVGDEKKDELTAENAGCNFTYISEYIER